MSSLPPTGQHVEGDPAGCKQLQGLDYAKLEGGACRGTAAGPGLHQAEGGVCRKRLQVLGYDKLKEEPAGKWLQALDYVKLKEEPAGSKPTGTELSQAGGGACAEQTSAGPT